MRHPLLIAGAALLLAAPAFAQSTVTIEKKTITKEVPESGSTVATMIIAPTPPPAAQIEAPPPPPAPSAVWTPGHWKWESDKYSWMRGTYVEPPRPHAAWVPGHWDQDPRGWLWVDGHWD